MSIWLFPWHGPFVQAVHYDSKKTDSEWSHQNDVFCQLRRMGSSCKMERIGSHIHSQNKRINWEAEQKKRRHMQHQIDREGRGTFLLAWIFHLTATMRVAPGFVLVCRICECFAIPPSFQFQMLPYRGQTYADKDKGLPRRSMDTRMHPETMIVRLLLNALTRTPFDHGKGWILSLLSFHPCTARLSEKYAPW